MGVFVLLVLCCHFILLQFSSGWSLTLSLVSTSYKEVHGGAVGGSIALTSWEVAGSIPWCQWDFS